MIHEYMTNIAPDSRPMQQSSPSDNSMSTATPPQGQISRASPASTALVMSSNNINGCQPASRQLTPNTSSSNNGTGSSSTGQTGQNGAPPNPMVRQFACHAKSMSAGVVVSVPGISNNLATGLNHPHNITGQNHHMLPNQHRALPMDPSNNTAHRTRNSHHHQHQVIREQQRNHHQQQVSHHQQQQQHHQQQHQTNQYHQNHGSSSQFINARQATSSSIILSNSNMNNLHNRSASTNLSSVLLASHNNNSSTNNNNNHHHHSQSNHHMTNSRNYPSNQTNSIWSIDENVAKSGKLTSSSYLPYLFNPSATDISCDNVSNASRLIDGAPAPGYYLHAPNNLPNPNQIASCETMKEPEFLPICDLLFNLISMIIYFCENTFGIIALIALYYHATSKYWALIGGVFVFASNFVCQYVSFKWLYATKLEDCKRKRESQEELEDEEGRERRYYDRMTSNMRNYQCGSCTWLPDSATEVQLKFLLSIGLNAITHILCLGFLVRYIKLVIPVTDTIRVKREARDLCLLRMLHSFIQSAPLLLLQAYIICSQLATSPLASLSVTSALLSLINVCWALASFTKYARRKYMNRFVLTWLGIVSQLLWRLGTVSSRVVALTIYAVYYGYWMLVILALHWLTMFLWLIKPGNLLRDELNLSKPKKVSFAMAIAWIYCFCYMNFEEHNSKLKMTSYYLIMFLENNLLLTVCLIFSSQVTWFKNLSIVVVYLGFAFGMLCMILYYKYFHVNILNNGLTCSQESVDSLADQLSPAGKKITGFRPGTLRLKSEDSLTSGRKYNNTIGGSMHTGSHPEITRNTKPPYLTSSQAPLTQSGAFKCKLNPEFKRHKIPSSHRRHES